MRKKVFIRGHAAVSIPPEIDVRSLRRRFGWSQNLFAARFGFPLATLRHWERGRRRPAGASLALLNVIAHNPRAVLLALRAPVGELPRKFRPAPLRRWGTRAIEVGDADIAAPDDPGMPPAAPDDDF